jgi:hypothetical protein
MVKELIFNERVFLKRQMSILFSVLVLFSFGTILGLCLGLLNTLGDEAQTIAEDLILSRTYHDAKADGREIAAAIEKKLSTITQGTSMTTTHYSSLLPRAITSLPPAMTFDSQAEILTKNTTSSTIALLLCAPAILVL